jgi:beta-N-acetylhexosaminidase
MRIRPFDPLVDRAAVATLWRSGLEPAWPVLPVAIRLLRTGFVAEDEGGRPIGFAGADEDAGSIPLLLVAPEHWRKGLGTALVAEALRHLRATGSDTVSAGNGGGDYIWPGVPLDLPSAVRFFAALGWRSREDTLDLTADLLDYHAPAGGGPSGTVLAVADGDERQAVMAFEAATFPSWTRWFERSDMHVLAARDGNGAIVGTLLFAGPDPEAMFAPLLGPRSGTIGCVGVAPEAQGRGIGSAMVARASEILRDRGTRACHIGWTVREAFYTRAGYLPWRRYRMFRAPQG